MTFQKFYDDVPKITLHDPLAKILGSSVDGLIVFGFTDIVKLAGHGCPTVAGAYLCAYHGLKALYPGETPVRGNVEVLLQGSESAGVNGVIANVIGSILGAAGIGGFGGLGGQFSRKNLLHYSQNIPTSIQLRRIDTKTSINISYHPEIVSGDPRTSLFLGKILNGTASADEEKAFKLLWNERLEKILCQEFNNPDLIKLTTY